MAKVSAKSSGLDDKKNIEVKRGEGEKTGRRE